MIKKYCQVSQEEGTSLIADQVEIAQGFFQRLRGLLGRKHLEEGQGMLLWPCSSIHCIGMRFPIDALFLDRQFRVVRVRENMYPGSFASCRQARYVLELKAGEVKLHNIKVQEQLQITRQEKENRTS